MGAGGAGPLIGCGYLTVDDGAGVRLAGDWVWLVVEPLATALGGAILAAADVAVKRSFRCEMLGLFFGLAPLCCAGLFGRLLAWIFG